MPRRTSAIVNIDDSADLDEEQRIDLDAGVVETVLKQQRVKRKRVGIRCSGSDDGEYGFGDDDDDNDDDERDCWDGSRRSKKLITASGTKRAKIATSRRARTLTGPGTSKTPSRQTRSHLVSLHKIKDAAPLRAALLAWYAHVHEVRGMPWRRPFDPTVDAEGRAQRAYEVWISEVMLQQTQVITVIPYYKKWMEKYPTIRHLARSDIESVNTLWKGLGYYSRAARLLAGAQKIVKEYGGRFPQSAKEMMANVPGIGRYSAGAIASIAYNHCEPVLDGNVMRVLSRVLALYANPKAKSTLDTLWTGATAMVNCAECPGDINQALIELGATVCKPRDPDCSACPINAQCAAYREAIGQPLVEEQDIEELCSFCEPVLPDEEADVGVTRYPMKIQRKKAREEVDVVNIIEWSGPGARDQRYILLARRPETGLLAGLHEFPSCSDVKDTKESAVLGDIAQNVLREVFVRAPHIFMPSTKKEQVESTVKEDVHVSSQLRVAKILPAGDVLHIFSHIRKTYRIQWILLEGGYEAQKADGDSDSKTLPPEVNPSFRNDSTTSRRTGPQISGRSKRKGKKQAKPSDEDIVLPIGLRWVQLEEVEDANISTGMMKVWNKIKMFWEQQKVEQSSSEYWNKFIRSS